MYYYGARWYDPTLGRFVQADTVVPGGVQGLDRYAYTFNNPMKYTDPSGHEICDADGYCGDDLDYKKDTTWIWYLNKMQEEFDWQVNGNWTYKELVLLYMTGSEIENYVDDLGGSGQGWVNKNLGNTIFYRGINAVITNKILGAQGSVPWKRGVNLSDGFDKYIILQELGHRWDNSSNNRLCPATWCGGGLADELVKYVGGDPKGLRWKNGVSDIPADSRWRKSVKGGYGNTASAEYFAESFVWLIIDQTQLPPANISEWMNKEIIK